MQSTTRRWAYYYDFQLESYPEDAPSFELDEVLNKIETFWKNGSAVHKYRNQEVTIRIKEMKLIKDYAVLLIHTSDVKATDPAFSNTETGQVRVEAKQTNEGIGAACHVIINRQTLNNKKGYHLSIVEEVVGLPKSAIETFINYLFRTSCTTNYNKQGSKNKKGNICRPKVTFNGHASSTLKESLTHSTLQGITLLNHNDGQYIDNNQELMMTEQVIRIKVGGSPSGSTAVSLIEKAKSFGAERKYDQVRVQYAEVVAEETVKDAKGEVKKKQIKKQRTIPFSAKESDIANLLFTKSELVELKEEIGQCENKVHSELANKMKKLLEKATK
jgi:hypothetical protein